MSLNELTSPDKLLTGCGDGARDEHPQKGVRTPVPSCRRFATRPPPPSRTPHRDDNHNVKIRLEKAIRELATHPNITRRRALTMAEIKPSRNVNKTTTIRDGFKNGRASLLTVAPRREGDAGRRVCQLLLLNAWRRKRGQVATLADSLQALESQKGKLELQIDVLRHLRQSECDKRTEAAAENQHLHVQIKETLKMNQILLTEKHSLELEIKALQQQREDLQAEIRNVRNDWMTVRCELKSMEHQMASEREKIRKLRDEKNLLLEKLSQKDQETLLASQQICDLQDQLISTEVNLQDALLCNTRYEDDAKSLSQRISDELKTNADLRGDIEEIKGNKAKLEINMNKLKETLYESNAATKRLENENDKLERDLAEAKQELKKERERPWWKSAGEVALAPLNALQSAAYILLPAVPCSRGTSTTDISMKPAAATTSSS